MTTTIKINHKTGLGEPINPYSELIVKYPDNEIVEERIKAYNNMYPPSPVITATGEILTTGKYKCENIWQILSQSSEYWFDAHKDTYEFFKNNFHDFSKLYTETRQVWKVIETPVTKFPETVKEVEEYEAIYGPPPELPDSMKEPAFLDKALKRYRKTLERQSKETVDEVLINIELPHDTLILFSDLAENYHPNHKEHSYLKCGFFDGLIFGANWQKENSIDRDKVIAEIEKRINLVTHYIGNTSIAFYDRERLTLTDLLQVIKQMK